MHKLQRKSISVLNIVGKVYDEADLQRNMELWEEYTNKY